MKRKTLFGMIFFLCALLVSVAAAAEGQERTVHFGADCPAFLREMLNENGCADERVICGAVIAYAEEGCAFLVTEPHGLTGIQWTEGTNNARVETYGSCGLELAGAVSVETIIEGNSPIDRRFALRLNDGACYEFVSTFHSSWRIYRYTGADSFRCTLNSGRMQTDMSEAFLPCSAWLGNWPDLTRFPKSEKEFAAFALERWNGIGERALVWGAHLREKPTGSSRSLGKVHVALAEVLEKKPGKSQPWYRVRIGEAEGWISGPYVEDTTDPQSFAFNASLGTPWAETQTGCVLYSDLKKKEPVRELAAGTFVQVLAGTEDGWALVLATDQPQDFQLNAVGRYGYVMMETVEMHSPWMGE